MAGKTISPKPKLGQNFLRDVSAARRIVDALGDVARKTVVEVGPGQGALTDELAKRAGRLVAIEYDKLLAVDLRMRYARRPNVEIVEGDVLQVDLGTIVRSRIGTLADRTAQPVERASLVGNLPYYITSDILLRIFQFESCFDVAVVMVQREVAERVAAAPGSRDYGLLSATAQLHAKVELLFTLPPGAFSPPPKVHSSVLRLVMRPQFDRLGVPPRGFDAFLKQAFAQKRKTLVNNLRTDRPLQQVREAMEETGIRPDARAEALSLDEMARLYKQLHDA